MIMFTLFEFICIVVFVLLSAALVYIFIHEFQKAYDAISMQYNFVLHRLDFLLKKLGALDEYFAELDKNEKPWEVSEEKEKKK